MNFVTPGDQAVFCNKWMAQNARQLPEDMTSAYVL